MVINPVAFPDLTDVRVLVVDDDADARGLFSQALSHSGALVLSAGSATSAISIFTAERERPPDVVVTDLSMPVHNGRWLLSQIRSLPPERGRDVRSSRSRRSGRQYSKERMLSIGFNEYLAKPLDPVRLCWAVADVARPGRS